MLEWLKKEAKDAVQDGGFEDDGINAMLICTPLVVLSNRLVKSACAIVAAPGGYTANVQKMMSKYYLFHVTHNVDGSLAASNAQAKRGGIIHEYALKAKLLEVNPRSPLIEGLLRRIKDLPTEEDERDLEAEEELKEVASILIDGALVRSGFEVKNSNAYVP